MMNKFLDPKNDFAFKKIFGTEKNKDILIHFINDMLGFTSNKRIKQVSFLKTIQDPKIASQKQSILDVLCTDPKGRQYIVEMQVAKTTGFEKRAQYYAAKAYGGQLNKSEKYDKLKEIIFVAITDFIMFPDKVEYKSDHVVLDKKTYEHDLKDFYFIFLELPKFNKDINELHTMIEKWAYFFKHAEDTHEKDVAKIVGSDEIIERAYEELNRFSWSEIEMNTYEAEEKTERDNAAALDYKLEEAQAKGKAEGFAEGEQKGKAEGKAEERVDMAKKLISSGVDINIIIQCTSLSEAEIKHLSDH